MVKAADALKGGTSALAITSTHHVKEGWEGFFDEVQRLLKKKSFTLAPVSRLSLLAADNIPEEGSEFEHSKRFGSVEFRQYSR